MGIDFGGLLALIWRYREDVELIKQAIGVYERGVVRRDEVGSQFINNGVNPNRIVEYIINPSNLFSHITREVPQLAVLRHCSVSTAVGDRESQPRVDERGLADIE